MTTTPALKLAVMNDLHIGGPAGGGFQNTFLTTDAATLLTPTVKAINRMEPDLVLIPGDLTHHAKHGELGQVRACLNELRCPFIACKGNHDCETPEAASRFEREFGGQAQPGVRRGPNLNLPDNIAVLVLESSWQSGGEPYIPGNPPLAEIHVDVLDQALEALDGLRPEWLLVVSHYPLVSEAAYVDSNGGKYAGHIAGGADLLKELTARAGAVLTFSGHNHYHAITTSEDWLQCSTAALAEYPAEFRSVQIEDGCVSISTATGAGVLLEATPSPEFSWVRGRPQDREITWRPG